MKSKKPLGRWMKWTTIVPLLALALVPAWAPRAAAQAGADAAHRRRPRRW